MKTNNFLKILLLHLFVVISIAAKSQQFTSCGDLKIDMEALKKAKQYETIHQQGARPLAANFLIRVYLHIGAYNDGSNPVTTPQALQQEFDTLKADYASANICFIFAGYDYVNNSNLDTNFTARVDDPNLFDPYRKPGCINVFYLQKIKGVNSACANNCGIGGTSLSIPNTFCLIAQGNIGPGRTISHEVGHCMGLLHTFEKNAGGLENINGSNSGSAGDQITDTPADPYAFNGNNCFKTIGCTYQGNCSDPNGEFNYIPPYTNLMSYWISVVSRACIPMLYLTPNQYARVAGYLSSDPGLIGCGSPPALTINNFSSSSGYASWTALNSISTTGYVNLTGSVQAVIGASTTNLNPGFHASSTPGGRIRITAKICN